MSFILYDVSSAVASAAAVVVAIIVVVGGTDHWSIAGLTFLKTRRYEVVWNQVSEKEI